MVRFRNKYTGDIRELVNVESVDITPSKSVMVCVLDDGSRWQRSQLDEHWVEVEPEVAEEVEA